MSGFIEKTVAEQGFAASWKLHMAPLVESASRRRHRQMLFGSVVTGLALGLGGAALFLAQAVPPDSPFAQPLFLVLVLALAALAALASWLLLLERDASLPDAAMAAVETHFAALFTRDENAAFAEVVLQDLVSDGVLDDADYRVMTHHAGSYRGCRIRLIAAQGTATRMDTSTAGRRDLVVARVSLPMTMTGCVNIDTDRSHLPADALSCHVDNDQFDYIFGITCSDRMATEQIVNARLAENLLMVQQQLANPLNSRAAKGLRVAVQIAEGSLHLVVQEPTREADGTGSGVARVEGLARRLIMRFATVPGLVDVLHGDSGNQPAFASLAVPEQSDPRISF